MTDFNLPCECGRSIAVTAGMAGSSTVCRCGRTVRVPSLSDLKAGAGLTRYEVNPAHRILQMDKDGVLPAAAGCPRCDGDTALTLSATVECEQAVGGDSGESPLWVVLLFGWLGALAVLARRGPDTPEHGGTVVAPARLRLCEGCQRRLGVRSRRVGFLYLLALVPLVCGLIVARFWSAWGLALLLLSVVFWWSGRAARRRQQAAIKEVLRGAPVYEELLDRYPQAQVVWR
ncbi:MAG TPA: hypothetical protein VKD90_14655 [Gemmataceae bacterium]|nr:hypothetical protein [Gemmataceae bacterium]